MKHLRKTKYIFVAFILLLSSCDEDWLEIKRDKALVVPTTLNDFRLLLTDEYLTSNDAIATSQCSVDEYSLTTESWEALFTPIERNAYLWKEDIFKTETLVDDWDVSYTQILTANVILEGLEKISVTSINETEWNSVRGGALYLRSRAFYNLVQSFAKPYDASTASSDLGIPLRLSSDINIPTSRASVQETYQRILIDLKAASDLLPETVAFKTDVSKPAAYGLLARIYLTMGDYSNALLSVNSCLEIQSTLIDYNTLDPSAFFPFTLFNEEVIHHVQIRPLQSLFVFFFPNYIADELHNSYDDNDLRKTFFFYDLGGNNYTFKGTYEGSLNLFTGIATDEMYLIRAECLARTGDIDEAMDNLNLLLSNRYATSTFSPLTATTTAEALDHILTERRKELIGRGLRWSDLRRLNKEPAYAITLTRTIDGITYTLPPNDPRYTLPIPEYIINVSGIQQNP